MHPKACTHVSEAPQKLSNYAKPILGLKDAPIWHHETISSIIKIMDVETYRYCIFFNCPSCGTNGPDSCAFPRSLAKGKQSIFKWSFCHLKRRIKRSLINLQSDDTVIRVTSNMEPCTWINQSWIPTLQHIVVIFQALS